MTVCVACCLLRLCYAVTAECMFLTGCMLFATWLSFFLAQFPLPQDGLLSILSKFLVQGTSVQMGTSPFFPTLCSKTHAPSPVEDCGVPSTKCGAVSRCVCTYGWDRGFMNLPSLWTHTYPAHMSTLSHSHSHRA